MLIRLSLALQLFCYQIISLMLLSSTVPHVWFVFVSHCSLGCLPLNTSTWQQWGTWLNLALRLQWLSDLFRVFLCWNSSQMNCIMHINEAESPSQALIKTTSICPFDALLCKACENGHPLWLLGWSYIRCRGDFNSIVTLTLV